MAKSSDIDNELKDFFGDVIKHLNFIDEKTYQDFLKLADDVFLNDGFKYSKWLLNTPEKDQNVDVCKSINFLSSEEFKKWPVEKKVHAIFYLHKIKGKEGLEIRITLADYENLIQKNKTDWSPYLKSLAASLVGVNEAIKTDFNLDYLGRNDFASWPAYNQCGFLRFYLCKGKFMKDLNFETLLKHPIFNKISRGARYLFVKMLIDRGQKPKDDIDKLDIPSLRKFELLESLGDDGDNKEFKTQNKLFNSIKVFEKQMKDPEDLKVEKIKSANGFRSLAPEEKIYALAKASDLKISDLEQIKNVEKITHEDVESNDITDIFENIFGKISERQDGGLSFASLIKSKLPPFARLEAFRYLNFVGDKNIQAFKIIANLGVLNLLSWKIEKSDKKLVDKDLSLFESTLIEFITGVQTFSTDLNLSKDDIEILKRLSEEVLKNKDKPLKKRIGTLEKIGRVILNILQVPLFFTDMGKLAQSWFFEPSKQVQYNAAKKKINRVLSKVKTKENKKRGENEK